MTETPAPKVIRAEFTSTESGLLFFATAKGWTEMIEGATGEMVVNPQTYIQFIQAFVQQVLKEQIGDPYIQFILAEAKKAADTQIAGWNAAIDAALVVVVE